MGASLLVTALLLAAVLVQCTVGITLHKDSSWDTPKEPPSNNVDDTKEPPSNNVDDTKEPPSNNVDEPPSNNVDDTKEPHSNIYKVKCEDREPNCMCPENETACIFMLVVQELQTFTSYKLREKEESFLSMYLMRLKTKGTVRRTIEGDTIRTTAGDTYYLDGRGFRPTLPPDERKNRPPEYGRCHIYKANSTVRTETFGEKNCSVPITVDGATFRMFVGINGQIPGPTLIMYEDQEIHIRVVNELTSEGITVHWHGMHQKMTPWMDGVGFVSQPPIIPGAHFDYVFQATPSGTHWYHSHIGAQRTDGLYGAFVVRERKQILEEMAYVDDLNCMLVDVPEEHTISLLDWQSESSLNLFVRIHSTLGYFPGVDVGRVPTQQNSLYRRTHSSDGVEVGPVPYWSGLMNGRGRHTDDTFSILSTFTVERGTCNRFRLIGAQSLYAFKFSIDGHKLYLIASDGHFIQREPVDYIIIHTGERYDFILHADREPGNYWMRAETLEADAWEAHKAEGILTYADAPHTPTPDDKYVSVPTVKRNCTRRRPCIAVNCPFKSFPPDMNTRCLHLDKLKAKTSQQSKDRAHTITPKILRPSSSDLKSDLKFFNFGFEGAGSTSAINGLNFKLPTTPYQTYCDEYQSELDKGGIVCPTNTTSQMCTNVAQIAAGQNYMEGGNQEYPSVNFVLSAVGNRTLRNNDFSHPIHLHGHTFYVVAVRHGYYTPKGKLDGNNEDVDCHGNACRHPRWREDKLPSYLRRQRRVRRDAILKDTVIVPAGGYVVIAFFADNPGYWFLHCHIEAHQLEGMALVVQEYPKSQQWAPPTGINRIGNFTWTLDDFNRMVWYPRTCANQTNIEY